MYFILTASKDTYITNKIINNAFSASDANVGRASTLDLFRLYNESFLSGVSPLTPTNEYTKALIKFDYTKISSLMKNDLNLNLDSFNCKLEMIDIMGGQSTPADFTLILFPLSQSFDEGIGKDVVSFADLDRANFITASYSNGTVYPWYLSGAAKEGVINKVPASLSYPDNIDYIVSGNLNDGNGTVGLGVAQRFIEGSENLSMDITTIVSATVAGILPDCGFRLSFTGSQENDTKTRFVKRFASRHVGEFTLQPRIAVSYDSSVNDNHKNFYFDLSGSLFLKNFHRGQSANIRSGSSLTPVTGNNCIKLTLRSGSWKQEISASQHHAGTKVDHPGGTDAISFVTGVYSASFAISSSDSATVDWGTSLADMISRTGSITFDEYWSSADGLTGYYTGSLSVKRISRTSFNISPRRLNLIVTNAKDEYKYGSRAMFRVFVHDFDEEQKAKKLPYSLSSVILDKVYYRIRDAESDKIIIPFKASNNGTKLSSDSEGLFFETYLDLAKGRTYTIDFLIKEAGIELIEEAKNTRFRVN